MEYTKYEKIEGNGCIVIFGFYPETQPNGAIGKCVYAKNSGTWKVGEERHCVLHGASPLEPRDYLLLLPEHGELAYSLFNKEFFQININYLPENFEPRDVLISCFSWAESPQGWEFWDNIYEGNNPTGTTNNIIDNQNKFETIQEPTIMSTKKVVLIAALTSLAVNILLNWWGLVIFAAFLYFWIWCGRKAQEIQKLNHEAILPSAINFIVGPISLFATIIVCEVCPWKVFFPFIPSFSLRNPIVKKEENKA